MRHLSILVVILFCASSSLTACGGGQSRTARFSDEGLEFPDEQSAARHSASPRVAAGERLLVEGDVEGAQVEFEAAVEEDPNDTRALLHLGLTQELQNEYDAAEASYRRALEVDPAFPEAHNNLGLLLLDRGRVAEAISELESAIAARDDYANAWLNLAYAKTAARDVEGARVAFVRSVELMPDDAEVRVHYGEFLLATEDQAAAAIEFRRGASLANGQASVLFAAAKGLRRAGQAAESVSTFERLIQTDTAESTDDNLPAEVYVEYAVALAAADSMEAALEALETAEQRNPELAIVHFLRGEVHARAGSAPEARAAYERYLQLDPNGPRAPRATAQLQAL